MNYNCSMLKESNSVKDTVLYRRVRRSVALHKMFTRGSVVLVAVSGGVDSVALLAILDELSKELDLTLVVCHLNHNLRGAESERDLDFTASLASSLGLRFESARLEPDFLASKGGSTQASAREARYGFFESVANNTGAESIATAHTLSDVSETMLMRFISGAGVGGLAGIPPVRLPYVRPLLESSREEIEAFAESVNLEFVVDSTNRSDKYLRNDIRHNLIGLLKERYNPNLLESLARSALNFRRDEEYLAMSATELFDRAVQDSGAHEIVLDRLVLLEAHPAILSRLLLKATEFFGARAGFYAVHVDAMCSLVESPNPSGSLNLPGGVRIARDYEVIRFVDTVPKKPLAYDMELQVPGRTMLPGPSDSSGADSESSSGASIVATVATTLTALPLEYKAGELTAYFDFDDIETSLEGLSARTFVAGDRMSLFGMSGHRKLKELFIDAKVPRASRASLPLVTVKGDIIWAVGLRRSSLFAVTQSTRRVLKLEYLK